MHRNECDEIMKIVCKTLEEITGNSHIYEA